MWHAASSTIGCLYYSLTHSCINLWELFSQSLLSDCHGQVTHKHRPWLLTTDNLGLFCWGGTFCLHGNIGWRWCNSVLTAQGCGWHFWWFLVWFCGSLVGSGWDIHSRTNSWTNTWSCLVVFIGNWDWNMNTRKLKFHHYHVTVLHSWYRADKRW